MSTPPALPQPPTSRAFRAAAAFMALLFAVAAAVQWNDPDPAYWMAIYGVSLLLSVRAVLGRVPLWPNLAALVVFLVLAARALPDLLGARTEAFTHWHMLSSEDEVAREAGGLLLSALWSAVQSAVAVGQRSSA